MKWYLLKENKCPKCEKDLMDGLDIQERYDKNRVLYKLLIHPCEFMIKESTFQKITSSQITENLARIHAEEEATI